MCFVVTRGATEIYDVITHLTFLNIEAQKLSRQVKSGNRAKREWEILARAMQAGGDLGDEELDTSLWNLSIILGRTFKETKETFEYRMLSSLAKSS